MFFVFFFQAEDGIRDVERSRGLGDVYKRQPTNNVPSDIKQIHRKQWGEKCDYDEEFEIETDKEVKTPEGETKYKSIKNIAEEAMQGNEQVDMTESAEAQNVKTYFNERPEHEDIITRPLGKNFNFDEEIVVESGPEINTPKHKKKKVKQGVESKDEGLPEEIIEEIAEEGVIPEEDSKLGEESYQFDQFLTANKTNYKGKTLSFIIMI
eukprot:TRINITY_DN9377_c0_g1_i2.p1 TRINITY_DN9377_c0_g1~~TRINITY_DN9377_c0_g1_i2.p1  ORF type:complete len:209 (-),score=67.85 TRINITY_DN9377_c0_g1_i2:48-674(-)